MYNKSVGQVLFISAENLCEKMWTRFCKNVWFICNFINVFDATSFYAY